MAISLLSAATLANLDATFDPYVMGTSPPATGLLDDSGVDIASNRYAPIVYGSAAPATSLLTQQSGNADVNTLFAAYGTASYSLPINGQTFTQECTIPAGGSGNSQIGFKITGGNTWTVYGTPTYGSPMTPSTGSVPAGATNIKVTYGTYSVPGGDTDAGGAVTNPASSSVALSTNPNTYYLTSNGGPSSGSRGRSYPVNIIFYNAGGSAISTTNITLIGETDGSA